MTEDYRQKQMVRMQKGTCSEEGCIIYSEMLTDFERIGDHILNIGQEMGMGKKSERRKLRSFFHSLVLILSTRLPCLHALIKQWWNQSTDSKGYHKEQEIF